MVRRECGSKKLAYLNRIDGPEDAAWLGQFPVPPLRGEMWGVSEFPSPGKGDMGGGRGRTSAGPAVRAAAGNNQEIYHPPLRRPSLLLTQKCQGQKYGCLWHGSLGHEATDMEVNRSYYSTQRKWNRCSVRHAFRIYPSVQGGGEVPLQILCVDSGEPENLPIKDKPQKQKNKENRAQAANREYEQTLELRFCAIGRIKHKPQT